MFSRDIVRSDAFLDMPVSSQLLYFQLGMEADDDGFLANCKMVVRMIGANEDDLKVLLGKRFLIQFPDGVTVIKHWRINNYLRNDRYKETKYLEVKRGLQIKENGAYTEVGTPLVHQMETQVRLGKDRLGKDSKETMSASKPADPRGFEEFWKAYPRKELKKRTFEIWKTKKLEARLPDILSFIAKAKDTDRWKKGFVKQPPAFLNGECWNDDLAAYNDSSPPISRTDLAPSITRF